MCNNNNDNHNNNRITYKCTTGAHAMFADAATPTYI